MNKWIIKNFGEYTVNFVVFPSGNFVIRSIHLDGKKVDSITKNRNVTNMVRFWILNEYMVEA